MLIRAKILLNNLGLATLALVAGSVGIVGFQQLSRSLTETSGPRWQTADATMEMRIALQGQELAIGKLLEGHDAAAATGELAKARATAKTSVDELASLGIAPQAAVAACRAELTEYDRALEDFLAVQRTWAPTRRELLGNTDAFETLGVQMEDVGDGAVEQLSRDPDRAMTWSKDVAANWEAADGCMEGRIYLLEQSHWLTKLEAGEQVEEARSHLTEALATQQQGFERIAKVPLFQVATVPGNRKALDVYRELLAARQQLVPRYLADLTRFAASRAALVDHGSRLDAALAKLENDCDELQAAALAAARANANRLDWVLTTTVVVSVTLGIAAAFLLSRWLGRRLDTLGARVRDIADGEGDLTKRLDVGTQDEIGTICGSFNEFLGKLQNTVRGIAEKANRVAHAASETTATALSLARGAEVTRAQSSHAAAAAEEMSTNMATVGGSTDAMTSTIRSVAAAVEQLTASIGEVAKNAEGSAQIANSAAQLTRASNERMTALGTAANEIGRVIESIQDIAEQTNLLALNATIEAARAGEAGKGFSVVANEVKDLARQTAEATQDIRKRIERIQTSTAASVTAIVEIDQVIAKVSTSAQQIAGSVGEQRSATQEISSNLAQSARSIETVHANVRQGVTATQEISKAIAEVDNQTRSTASAAEQASTAGKTLTDLSGELRQLVGQFKV